jgi:DNA-binding FrmR family transcriptional regulator
MDTSRLPDDVRADVTARLNRAAGQLRAVVRMLDEGADCQQTARQLAAAKRAVDRAGVRLLSGGLVASPSNATATSPPTSSRSSSSSSRDGSRDRSRQASRARLARKWWVSGVSPWPIHRS